MSRARLTFVAAVATLGAASGLSAVFDDISWLPPVAGGIAVVAAVNEVARRTRVAAAIGPLLSAAAVLLYVTAIDTGSLAYAGLIPTGSSLRALGDLARGGFDDVRSLATPVPPHKGLVLLAIVGIAAIELVVDLLAVTLRRAAVAGLPLLAVFVLCTSVSRHGVGWIPFANATAGYLWLLLADSKDRVVRWGRALGNDTMNRSRVSWADLDNAPSPLSALGRRVGVTAIAIGVVVPLLIPGLHGGLPKHGGSGLGTGNGSSRVVTINPIVTLKAQLVSAKATPVLTMTSTDPSPVYLRLTALDRFDGTTFSPSELTAPSGQVVRNGFHAPSVTGTAETTTVNVQDLEVHWLPVPTQAEAVTISGDWHYDAPSNTIFSARTTTRNVHFTVTSIRTEPTAADLRNAPVLAPGQMAQFLALPAVPSDIDALAAQITAKATTAFDKALAIQNYLTAAPFTYSTDVAPNDSMNALEDFLLHSKTGFCQQYAAAMAVLARIAGIPSRVAVGFTHGDPQKDGSWLVTTHDAHAWPELYFPTFGWMPFEPTPRTDGQAIRPTFTVNTNSANNGGTDVVPPKPGTAKKNNSALSQKLQRLLDGDSGALAPAEPAPAAAVHHHSAVPWGALAIAIGILLTVPGVSRVVARRRRRSLATKSAVAAHAAWAELRAVVIDAGLPWADEVTPRTAARLLAAETPLDPRARDGLGVLVTAEERSRYAPGPAAGDDERLAQLWPSVAAVHRALVHEQPPATRLLAVVMPRSTLRTAQVWAGRVADVLDLVDVTAARLRRAIGRRLPRPA